MTSGVKRLLSIRNINVNVKYDEYGETSLHCAALNGHVEIVRLLLQNGADVKAKSNGGSTPLHWAAKFGHVDILHLLLENGADLEAQDDKGKRTLHWVTGNGHFPFIRELISRYHVDINARSNYGETALWNARDRRERVIMDFFGEIGGTEYDLIGFLDANCGTEYVIDFLEANGGIEYDDINFLDADCGTEYDDINFLEANGGTIISTTGYDVINFLEATDVINFLDADCGTEYVINFILVNGGDE